jgi:hypothetical protein
MKRPNHRTLKLGAETVKVLSRPELAQAVAGLARGVNAATQQLSWCECVPPR